MGLVADILARKGRAVHTVDREASAFEAVEKMVRENVGSLVVTDRGATVGIITERDFLRRIALEERNPRATRVWEVMTERLVCTDPGRSVEECMAVMTQARIRHLPVVDRGRLAGLISIGDLIKHLSDEKHGEVRHLTDYIAGRYPA